MSSWENSAKWYAKITKNEGHYYHQHVILPNLLKLACLQKGDSLLELGCGEGVLARHLPKEISYTGIDLSPTLIKKAKERAVKGASFLVADAAEPLPVKKCDFSLACFLLSLQNMERGDRAILQASKKIKPGGKLLLILNHPCFRIPRQSSWEIDPKTKMQYRKIQRYLTPLKIPIDTHPGKKGAKSVTMSYHSPLSTYSKWLMQAGLYIESLEEWISDKTSQGKRKSQEDLARKEFPLFLAILAKKEETKK